MTREKLIHLIYTSDDERVCNCNDCLRKKELEDFKVGDCIRCAEKKLDEFLAEHDKHIREEVIVKVMNITNSIIDGVNKEFNNSQDMVNLGVICELQRFKKMLQAKLKEQYVNNK